MISFFKLIRYKNLLMVLGTMVLTKYALIHSFVAQSCLTSLEFSILALSVVFITAGGYLINDIFDVDVDKINKPNKVFIGYSIALKNAWFFYFFFTFCGLILGVFLSFYVGLAHFSAIFICTSFSLFLYAYYFKKKLLIGNLLISFCVSLTIYIVYLFDFKYIPLSSFSIDEQTNSMLHFNVWLSISVYLLISFVSTLSREIIKDMEDLNGDYAKGMKTLPIVFGRKTASNLAFFFAFILFLGLFISVRYVYSMNLYNMYPFVFILLPLLYFLYKLWISKTKKDYHFLSNLMKVIMLFGILSMLLFQFQ
jgi:4-hydroxybenzoate polyprenyltransferase